MRATRRTQILMNPEEYRRLRDLARKKKISVGELIRSAVRTTYLEPRSADKKAALEEILRMNLPAISWRRAKKEIEAGHACVH
ncbi:MAG: ribbon-helix-helix protein, CopG family [Terriglobia bacterium]